MARSLATTGSAQGPTTVVTGATGRVGGEVVRLLRGRGLRVVPTSSRHGVAVHGQPARRLDWQRAETWGPVLGRCDRLLLVVPEVPSRLADALADAVHRAVEDGLRRIVLLSALGVGEAGDTTGMLGVEHAVRTSGAEWVVLRPNTFMQNLISAPLVGPIRRSGQLYAPVGQARVSVVDALDVAAVAATALVGDLPSAQTLVLTGPDALTFADLAAVMGQAADRIICHVDPGADGMRMLLRDAGLPPPVAELVLSFYAGLRTGRHETVTGDVESALQRPPTSFSRFAAREATAWQR